MDYQTPPPDPTEAESVAQSGFWPHPPYPNTTSLESGVISQQAMSRIIDKLSATIDEIHEQTRPVRLLAFGKLG